MKLHLGALLYNLQPEDRNKTARTNSAITRDSPSYRAGHINLHTLHGFIKVLVLLQYTPRNGGESLLTNTALAD